MPSASPPKMENEFLLSAVFNQNIDFNFISFADTHCLTSSLKTGTCELFTCELCSENYTYASAKLIA